MEPATISSLLQNAVKNLQARSDTPSADGEILLAHALGKPRSYLRTWPERLATPEQQQKFAMLLARRLVGEPVAYLTGAREFWSLALKVTPATLIPRPETELLVEQALVRLAGIGLPRILDLGTGSGAIALALARHHVDSQITAVDLSIDALVVARQNGVDHGLTNVDFQLGHWFEPVAGRRFHMIVSNPPYVAEQDPHLNRGDLRFEPRLALSAGPDGLSALAYIAGNASAYLEPGGWLLMEHGYDQGAAVRQLMEAAGFVTVDQYADLDGHVRLSAGRCPV